MILTALAAITLEIGSLLNTSIPLVKRIPLVSTSIPLGGTNTTVDTNNKKRFCLK